MSRRPNRSRAKSTPTSDSTLGQRSAVTSPLAYPFTAIVGQEEMKLALMLSVVAPSLGGVLVMGHRGTGKSTAVRALAKLLPPVEMVAGCAFNCDPQDAGHLCHDCRARPETGGPLAREIGPVGVVELPLNATEDRVCGTLNFGRALGEGIKVFEPGLLARANRGFLYVDEVNLLEDHLVDLLLDAAATGRSRVEREGVSVEHPARFVLVGSGNPEEGELRPQLLDRFGLYAEIQTVMDVGQRVEIVERRERFELDPQGFCAEFGKDEKQLGRRLLRARKSYAGVSISRELLRRVAELCLRLKVDGHRGELTIARAARAAAALDGRREATEKDVRRVAALALRHRLRRDPLERTDDGERIGDQVSALFGDEEPGDQQERGGGGEGTGGRAGARNRSNGVGPKSERQLSREGETLDHAPPATDVAERPAPPAASPTLPAPAGQTGQNLTKPHVNFLGRQRGRGAKKVDAGRGRFTRAACAPSPHGTKQIALAATLFAAVESAVAVGGSHSARRAVNISHEHLRFKRFSAKAGTLFIFAVDTSGSMALNRIRQAKGALAELLRRSYVNRDRIALISFRGRAAEVLLGPSQSPATCKRLLDQLPVGGGTPLASALLRSLEIARQASRHGTTQISLLVFTDGRANVPHATDLR
ncbi:MAG: magnesium chelatase ATPase subunit I, partial [Pyrinomonadaceae bacterium]